MGNLNRKLFTEENMRRLETNPNVQHVSETNITYTSEFKLAAVRAYEEGEIPSEIFIKAGFDLDLIGHKKPKNSLKRWSDTYAKYGESGIKEERRGKFTRKGILFCRIMAVLILGGVSDDFKPTIS